MGNKIHPDGHHVIYLLYLIPILNLSFHGNFPRAEIFLICFSPITYGVFICCCSTTAAAPFLVKRPQMGGALLHLIVVTY